MDQDKTVTYGEDEEFDFGRLEIDEKTYERLTPAEKEELRGFGVTVD